MLGPLREMASVSPDPPGPGRTPSTRLRSCLIHLSLGPPACPPHPCLVPSSYPPPHTGTCLGLCPGSWASWSERAKSLVTLGRHCSGPPPCSSSFQLPHHKDPGPHAPTCAGLTHQLPLLQTHIEAPGLVRHQLPQGHPQFPQGRRLPPSPQPWVLTHTQPGGRPGQTWPGKASPPQHPPPWTCPLVAQARSSPQSLPPSILAGEAVVGECLLPDRPPCAPNRTGPQLAGLGAR